jgi:hypothetical protein
MVVGEKRDKKQEARAENQETKSKSRLQDARGERQESRVKKIQFLKKLNFSRI